MVIRKKQDNCGFEGALTIYLVLTMTILLSLCLTMIKSVQDSAARLRVEIVTDTAIESCFAEYHRELLSQYNLFAIDTGYLGNQSKLANTNNHFEEYAKNNLSYDGIFASGIVYRDFIPLSLRQSAITGARFLTDGNGKVFRDRAIEAIKDDIGLSTVSKVTDWVAITQDNHLSETDILTEFDNASEELDNTLKEIETFPEDYEDPVSNVKEKRKLDILSAVIDDVNSISKKDISGQMILTKRIKSGLVNQGTIQPKSNSEIDNATQKILFIKYIKRYFGNYCEIDEADALLYQMEYLINGSENDRVNLQAIAYRLLLLRTAAANLYLQGNEEKCKIVELVSDGLALLLGNPELAPLFKQTILLGWSVMEGYHDVKLLFGGKKVPLLKNDSNWYYSLSGIVGGLLDTLLHRNDSTEENTEDASQTGLSYEDYLEMFLYTLDMNTLTMRTMDLIEQDIRTTDGNSQFRMDGCVDKLQIEAVFSKKGGGRYTINRTYEY